MLGKQGKKRTHFTETFQSQGHEDRGSRFFMDRTLYKGIKQNNVSKIIDVSSEGGQLGSKSLPSEHEQLSQIVIEMRKKYDEVKTQTSQLQSQLQKHRKAADMLKSQQTRLKGFIDNAKSNLDNSQKQYSDLFGNLQARVYDMDIYKQSIATLKHDILIIKKRNFDKDLQLKQQKIKMKGLKLDDFNRTQLSFKCRDMLQSIQKVVVNKQYERNSKINTFYDALNKRQQNLRKRQERDKQIQQVMMKAMSQKLQQQKQWINICFVNLFLKKFLKCKMERLINQNEQVEGAYHKIRSNTDIKDCKDLITRFLNREKDYGVLLGSISQKQSLLQNLKTQRQSLQKTNLELKLQAQVINDSVHKDTNSTGSLQKKLQWFEQSLKVIEQKKQLINKWATKFNCSFSNKSRQQIQQKNLGKSQLQLIKDVLLDIAKYLDVLLGDENSSASINSAYMSTRPSDKTFDDEMINRNKRVKTSIIEDSFVEGEDKDLIYDGNSQADFLQYNRRVTKKNDQTRRFRIKTQLK